MPVTRLNISRKKFTTAYFKIAAIKTRFRVVKGGSAASKSYSIAQNEILIALKSVEKVLVIRKVASTLKDSVYASFKNRLNEFGLQGQYGATLSPLDITLANGSQFLFRGLDDPEKIKSIEGITRIFIEEATELDEDDIDELDRRVRSGNQQQITLAFNPISEKHWIKARFFDHANDEVKTAITVTIHDNEYADESQRAVIERYRINPLKQNQYRVYGLGEWGRLITGSEYYPAFNRFIHVGKWPYLPELRHSSISWDWNVTPYLTCVCAQVEIITRHIDKEGKKYDVATADNVPIQVTRVRFYREYTPKPPLDSVKYVASLYERDHPTGTTVDYYGDAQGNNRIEGMGGLTRFGEVQQHFAAYTYNQSKKAKLKNISPFKRQEFINDVLSGEHPDIEIVFDESCIELIDDMENCLQGIKGKLKNRVKNPVTKETYEEHGHASDALEYLVCEMFKDRIKNA